MAVRKDDGFETTNDGRQRHWRMTRGWKLLITWKDGSTSWAGAFKGPEGIFSNASGGIRCGKQDCRGTCLCLVDKVFAM
jgi:hypothetical protein